MSYIEFDSVFVDFPIYNTNSRSIKATLLEAAVGGRLRETLKGKAKVSSLDFLNFVINDGDRVGLVGGNGSGKTTLLRLLGRIYTPTRGKAIIEGEVGSLIDISLGIDPEITGRENIYLRGALLGLSKKQIKNKLEEIIDFSELSSFIDLPVRTYSSGMHLRLAFSVSTVIRPEILLMDEWLSVGDNSFREKAEIRMNELICSTNILVIATHSKDLIMNMCNRVIWLEHGRIKMDSTPKDVCRNYFS